MLVLLEARQFLDLSLPRSTTASTTKIVLLSSPRTQLRTVSGWLACDGDLHGLPVPTPGLRSGRELPLPPGGRHGVVPHLLVAAVLAAEGRVASVHEDVSLTRSRGVVLCNTISRGCRSWMNFFKTKRYSTYGWQWWVIFFNSL